MEHLDTQYNLALCYDNEEGTTRNSEKAFELYSKVARAGHLDAQYFLGVSAEMGDLVVQYYFYSGLGTTKDFENVKNLSPQSNLGMHHQKE
ncbi:hypothetical protein G9A89_004065 [Geosiphon pyriformis]|nr:hypothetical protein G9A89_004065 [Geosiphon pyriformis]